MTFPAEGNPLQEFIEELRDIAETLTALRPDPNFLRPQFFHAYQPTASDIKSARKVSVSDSTTRVTVATPASGTKIRIVSCALLSTTATSFIGEVYFATGTNITTTAGKEIMAGGLTGDNEHNAGLVWPDGGGPIGAVDDVVSLRTDTNVSGGASVIIHYREE